MKVKIKDNILSSVPPAPPSRGDQEKKNFALPEFTVLLTPNKFLYPPLRLFDLSWKLLNDGYRD